MSNSTDDARLENSTPSSLIAELVRARHARDRECALQALRRRGPTIDTAHIVHFLYQDEAIGLWQEAFSGRAFLPQNPGAVWAQAQTGDAAPVYSKRAQSEIRNLAQKTFAFESGSLHAHFWLSQWALGQSWISWLRAEELHARRRTSAAQTRQAPILTAHHARYQKIFDRLAAQKQTALQHKGNQAAYASFVIEREGFKLGLEEDSSDILGPEWTKAARAAGEKEFSQIQKARAAQANVAPILQEMSRKDFPLWLHVMGMEVAEYNKYSEAARFALTRQVRQERLLAEAQARSHREPAQKSIIQIEMRHGNEVDIREEEVLREVRAVDLVPGTEAERRRRLVAVIQSKGQSTQFESQDVAYYFGRDVLFEHRTVLQKNPAQFRALQETVIGLKQRNSPGYEALPSANETKTSRDRLLARTLPGYQALSNEELVKAKAAEQIARIESEAKVLKETWEKLKDQNDPATARYKAALTTRQGEIANAKLALSEVAQGKTASRLESMTAAGQARVQSLESEIRQKKQALQTLAMSTWENENRLERDDLDRDIRALEKQRQMTLQTMQGNQAARVTLSHGDLPNVQVLRDSRFLPQKPQIVDGYDWFEAVDTIGLARAANFIGTVFVELAGQFGMSTEKGWVRSRLDLIELGAMQTAGDTLASRTTAAAIEIFALYASYVVVRAAAHGTKISTVKALKDTIDWARWGRTIDLTVAAAEKPATERLVLSGLFGAVGYLGAGPKASEGERLKHMVALGMLPWFSSIGLGIEAAGIRAGLSTQASLGLSYGWVALSNLTVSVMANTKVQDWEELALLHNQGNRVAVARKLTQMGFEHAILQMITGVIFHTAGRFGGGNRGEDPARPDPDGPRMWTSEQVQARLKGQTPLSDGPQAKPFSGQIGGETMASSPVEVSAHGPLYQQVAPRSLPSRYTRPAGGDGGQDWQTFSRSIFPETPSTSSSAPPASPTASAASSVPNPPLPIFPSATTVALLPHSIEAIPPWLPEDQKNDQPSEVVLPHSDRSQTATTVGGLPPGMKPNQLDLAPALPPDGQSTYLYDTSGRRVAILNTKTGDITPIAQPTQKSSANQPHAIQSSAADNSQTLSGNSATSNTLDAETTHDPKRFGEWLVTQVKLLQSFGLPQDDNEQTPRATALRQLKHLSDLATQLELLMRHDDVDQSAVDQLEQTELPNAVFNYWMARTELLKTQPSSAQSSTASALVVPMNLAGEVFLLPIKTPPQTLLKLYQSDRENPNGFGNSVAGQYPARNYSDTVLPVVSPVDPTAETDKHYRLRAGFRPPSSIPITQDEANAAQGKRLTVSDVAAMQNRAWGETLWLFSFALQRGDRGFTHGDILRMQSGKQAGPIVQILTAHFYTATPENQRLQREIVEDRVFWQVKNEWRQLSVIDLETYRPDAARMPSDRSAREEPKGSASTPRNASFRSESLSQVIAILKDANDQTMLLSDLVQAAARVGVDSDRIRRWALARGEQPAPLIIQSTTNETGAVIEIVRPNPEVENKIAIAGAPLILKNLRDPAITPWGMTTREKLGGGERALNHLLEQKEIERVQVRIDRSPKLYWLSNFNFLSIYQLDSAKYQQAIRLVYLALTQTPEGTLTLEVLARYPQTPNEQNKSAKYRQRLSAADVQQFPEIFEETVAGQTWRLRPIANDPRKGAIADIKLRAKTGKIKMERPVDWDLLGNYTLVVLVTPTGEQLTMPIAQLILRIPPGEIMQFSIVNGLYIFRQHGAPPFDSQKSLSSPPVMAPSTLAVTPTPEPIPLSTSTTALAGAVPETELQNDTTPQSATAGPRTNSASLAEEIPVYDLTAHPLPADLSQRSRDAVTLAIANNGHLTDAELAQHGIFVSTGLLMEWQQHSLFIDTGYRTRFLVHGIDDFFRNMANGGRVPSPVRFPGYGHLPKIIVELVGRKKYGWFAPSELDQTGREYLAAHLDQFIALGVTHGEELYHLPPTPLLLDHLPLPNAVDVLQLALRNDGFVTRPMLVSEGILQEGYVDNLMSVWVTAGYFRLNVPDGESFIGYGWELTLGLNWQQRFREVHKSLPLETSTPTSTATTSQASIPGAESALAPQPSSGDWNITQITREMQSHMASKLTRQQYSIVWLSLRGYSAQEIRAILKEEWPRLNSTTIKECWKESVRKLGAPGEIKRQRRMPSHEAVTINQQLEWRIAQWKAETAKAKSAKDVAPPPTVKTSTGSTPVYAWDTTTITAAMKTNMPLTLSPQQYDVMFLSLRGYNAQEISTLLKSKWSYVKPTAINDIWRQAYRSLLIRTLKIINGTARRPFPNVIGVEKAIEAQRWLEQMIAEQQPQANRPADFSIAQPIVEPVVPSTQTAKTPVIDAVVPDFTKSSGQLETANVTQQPDWDIRKIDASMQGRMAEVLDRQQFQVVLLSLWGLIAEEIFGLIHSEWNIPAPANIREIWDVAVQNLAERSNLTGAIGPSSALQEQQRLQRLVSGKSETVKPETDKPSATSKSADGAPQFPEFKLNWQSGFGRLEIKVAHASDRPPPRPIPTMPDVPPQNAVAICQAINTLREQAFDLDDIVATPTVVALRQLLHCEALPADIFIAALDAWVKKRGVKLPLQADALDLAREFFEKEGRLNVSDPLIRKIAELIEKQPRP